MAPVRRREGESPPDYGPNTEEFSVEVHYGGYICGIDAKVYVDEKISWFDFCEVDTWSLLWIEDFAEQLGYHKDVHVKAYWLLLGKTLSNGLRRIKGDADTNCMVSFVPKHKTLVIYLDEIGVLEGVDWDDFCDIGNTPQEHLVSSPLKSEGGEQLSSFLPNLHKVSGESPKKSKRLSMQSAPDEIDDEFKGHIVDTRSEDELWACARSASVSKWRTNMERMKELDKDAYEWLEALPPNEWCRAFFRQFPCCDILLNNNCEVFNRWILEARKEPIMKMMESIRCKLMTRLYNNYTTAVEKWSGVLCPKIAAKLQKNADLANT
ncbi:unnamed protein product [Urochloa humidicola]